MANISEKTVGNLYIIQVDVDPTVEGVRSPVGSLALLDNGVGGIWQKTNTADTDWTRLSIGFANPVSIGSANAQGVAVTAARSDHVHEGVHGIRQNAGPYRFGNLTLQNGGGVTITEPSAGVFMLSVSALGADLLVSAGAGLTVSYTSGRVNFNGVVTDIAAGSVAVPASTTNGWVYVTTAGVVAAGATIPDGAVALAQFTSSASAVTGVSDKRSDVNPNVIWGIASDYVTLGGNTVASAGTFERHARSNHTHPIATGMVITQLPDVPNAAGSSNNIARADHSHLIPSDVPVSLTPDQANTRGTATAFALYNHVHNVPTGVPVGVSTVNAQGVAATFTRSDHTHQGVFALKVGAGGTNRFGTITFANGSGLSVVDNGSGTFTFDTVIGGSELFPTAGAGLSVNYTAGRVFANGAFVNVPAGSVAVPASSSGWVYVDFNDGIVKTNTTAFIPAAAVAIAQYTSTASAVTVSDRRIVQSNSLQFAAPVQQLADQAISAGTSNAAARSDHVHNLPTAIVGDVGTANAQGVASTFTKSDHTHRGLRSLKAGASGVQRFGDVALLPGTNATLVDDGAGNFTISYVAQATLETRKDNVNVNNPTSILNFIGPGASVVQNGAGRTDVTVLARNYIAVTTETEFLTAITTLTALAGGTIHITAPINLTANRTVDLSNIRVIAGGSITNALNFNGFVLTLTGSDACFANVRFRGEVATAGSRSQRCFAVGVGSLCPDNIWFDNCFFKNIIGSVAPDINATPNGVVFDLTAAGDKFLNLVFENCNANSDFASTGGTLLSGLSIRNSHGSNRKFIYVTGHIGQNEGRNRFVLMPPTGTPVAAMHQSFITDGSAILMGTVDTFPLGLNTYVRSQARFATSSARYFTSDVTLSLEPESPNFVDLNSSVVAECGNSTRTLVLPSMPYYADGMLLRLYKTGPYNLILQRSDADIFFDNSTSYVVRGNSVDVVLFWLQSARTWVVTENHRRLSTTITTTTNAQTTSQSFTIPTDSIVLAEVKVIARRTGGTAGAAGDSAAYIRRARYKNVGGVVTLLGLTTEYTQEDQVSWDATMDLAGTTGRVRVTGATNNNITWVSSLDIEVLV